MTRDPTIVVLRGAVEGISMGEYADCLRERLPDHDVEWARTPAQERELSADAEILTGRMIDESLLDTAERLGLFACSSAGYDHLPIERLRKRGVAVTNASGIHAPGIAEQVLGYVLTFTRRLHEGWRRQQRREWRHYQADELVGKTVTVVGLGAIGSAVVQRLDGFGVSTIGVRYTPEKGGPTDEVIGFEDDAFHDALSRTDVLVVASPLSETTRGLVGREELTTLPPNALVVNVGRGPIIETDALVRALRKNDIGGAALDVTDPEPLPESHPLWSFDNVLITPHMGGHNPRHWDRLAEVLEENVARIEASGEYTGLRNQVLSPD